MKINEIINNKDCHFSCIYLWYNNINGKVYVGQTQDFCKRMKSYYSGDEDKRLIGQAIKKYGVDNFDIFVLEKDVPLDKLTELEQYWMDYYLSYERDKGYNLCKEAATTRGYHHTKEDKERMSKIKKQFLAEHPEKIKCGEEWYKYHLPMSEENREKLRQRNYGNQYHKDKSWTPSEDWVEKHRQFMLGRQHALGHRHSEETKAKISTANRRRSYSEETLRKMSEGHKGKTARRVRCIDTNIIYESIQAASQAINKDASSISKCCRGKQKTVAGYRWEYINN